MVRSSFGAGATSTFPNLICRKTTIACHKTRFQPRTDVPDKEMQSNLGRCKGLLASCVDANSSQSASKPICWNYLKKAGSIKEEKKKTLWKCQLHYTIHYSAAPGVWFMPWRISWSK